MKDNAKMALETSDFDQQKPRVCVLDASTYVGFWVLKGLLSNGYTVHAAIQKNGKLFIYFFKEPPFFSCIIFDKIGELCLICSKNCCRREGNCEENKGYGEKRSKIGGLRN